MSNISLAYDALKARLVTLYPSHAELEVPEEIERNLHQTLVKAYGITFLAAENTRRFATQQIRGSYRRQFGVRFTREVTSAEFDLSSRDSVRKDLFEDVFILFQDISKNPKLFSAAVIKAEVISDTGSNFVKADKIDFVWVEVVVEIEIFEAFS